MAHQNDHDLLITIAERSERIERDVEDLKRELGDKYVTKAEFAPVRSIAFTIVGTVGVAVLLGLLAVIIQKSA